MRAMFSFLAWASLAVGLQEQRNRDKAALEARLAELQRLLGEANARCVACECGRARQAGAGVTARLGGSAFLVDPGEQCSLGLSKPAAGNSQA